MFKTVSSDCNLDCSYCYYRESLEGKRPQRRIDPVMLERFIPQYMEYIADTHQANLSWQGGEPTLAGLDFYRFIVGLEAKNAKPPVVIGNVLQTNGTLLDDDWGSFLKTYNFLVGISLDGPEYIHNYHRKNKAGAGSFHRVMQGIDVLNRHGVDYNILCVVGLHNVAKAIELMQFFRKNNMSFLQFMPAMDFQSTEPDKPASYLVNPQQYGEFLCTLFDEWYQGGIPTTSIRTFDNFLQSYTGCTNDLCIHSETCNAGVVVEYNGDIYPCDFYIHPDWKLGNIFEKSLKDMLESQKMKTFIEQKQPLPETCRECRWQQLCKGECFRNRRENQNGTTGVSYFCQSYLHFFEYAYERLARLGERIANYQRYLQYSSDAKENEKTIVSPDTPCPCGSGIHYKNCCGDPALKNSYLFQVGN